MKKEKLELEQRISIVIPYKNIGDDDELRLVLRSIEKNAKFNYQVVILGEPLEWINPENVVVLNEHVATAAVNPKAFNVIDKMRNACQNKLIDNLMLMTYDDIIFLNPVTKEDITEVVANGLIPEDPKHPWTASAVWVGIMLDTLAALKRNKMSTYNCETHLPRLFDKEKLAALFEKFGFKKRAYCFPTLYYNEYFTEMRCLDTEPKNTKVGLYFNDDYANKVADFDTHLFLNWSQNQWTEELKEKLFELFPEKSQFEI